MPLHGQFWSAVEPLRAPMMGTELMGPLLYSLVRSLRPRSVVEAGMGYTSPFIAQALADNLEDFNKEILQIEAKLRSWDERRQILIRQHREAELNRIHLECMISDPALASPSYYCSEYRPTFHAVDKMMSKETTAPKVLEILERLGLLKVVKVHNSDFKSFLDKVDSQCLPFDLIWNDADGLGGVGFKELFELLNPDGGVLILHDTLTTEAGQKIVRAAKQAQATDMFEDFELFNLLEPHKMVQTSATLIRRISGHKPNIFPYSMTGEIEQEIRRFLEIRTRNRNSSAN